MVFLGSPESVNNTHIPWSTNVLDVVINGINYGTPILGICFGAQLLARALGGSVTAIKQELGWHPVFDVVQQSNRMVFQWHSEGFKLPSNTQRLFLGAEDCCQGFAYKKIIATQFHFEVTQDEIYTWARNQQKDQHLENQIISDTSLYLESQYLLANKLMQTWLEATE